MFQLIMKSRDGGNILEQEYANSVVKLNDFVVKNISVIYQGRNWTYEDLCLGWMDEGCHRNIHLSLISNLFNGGVNISFPTFR